MQNSRECRQGTFHASILSHSMLSMVRWQWLHVWPLVAEVRAGGWAHLWVSHLRVGQEHLSHKKQHAKSQNVQCTRTGGLILGRLQGSGEGKRGWTVKVYSAKESSLFPWQQLLLIKMFVCSDRWLPTLLRQELNRSWSQQEKLPLHCLELCPSFQNLCFQISSSALQLFSFHSDFFSLEKQSSPSVILPCNSPVQHFLPRNHSPWLLSLLSVIILREK